MTNYEAISSLSFADMTEFLLAVKEGFIKTTLCDEDCGSCACDSEVCAAMIERWLESESEF